MVVYVIGDYSVVIGTDLEIPISMNDEGYRKKKSCFRFSTKDNAFFHSNLFDKPTRLIRVYKCRNSVKIDLFT
jgi:hypothetical protein